MSAEVVRFVQAIEDFEDAAVNPTAERTCDDVRREELDELHFITPIENVPSILIHGILCHQRAARLDHRSVAMPEIQDRRARVVVPGGRPLHQYANLYFCARNPMLYKRLAERATLAVLRVSTNVLDLPEVVVTDQNAASGYVRWASGAAGLAIVNRELVFAEYWTHPGDPIQTMRHRSIKCAEVLVPGRVDPSFVLGAYVCDDSSRDALRALAPSLHVVVDRQLFFQR